MSTVVLAIRTDKPEAELYLYSQAELLDSYKWEAHRQLSDTLLIKIEDLLSRNSYQLAGLNGIVIYKGPGSFTGLRIGISVANTLAYALDIPILGTSGSDWQEEGLKCLENTSKETFVVPEYGGEVHITAPRK